MKRLLAVAALLAAVASAVLVYAQAYDWVKLGDDDYSYEEHSWAYAYVEGYTPVPADGHLHDVKHDWNYDVWCPSYCVQITEEYIPRSIGDRAFTDVTVLLDCTDKDAHAHAEIVAPPPGAI